MEKSDRPDPVRGAWARERDTLVVRGEDLDQEAPQPFAISSTSLFVEEPLEFTPHSHPNHKLVWVQGGMMTVRLADRVVTVPEGYGIWLPSGAVHSGRTTAKVALCEALFVPASSRVGLHEPTTVEVTPLLGSLLIHLGRTDLGAAERGRAEAVVFDVLVPAARQLLVQVPHVDRLEPIVTALLEDPTDDRRLSDWAGLLGISERTVARLFRDHTGLSFMQWRQVLRIHRALSLMAEGLSVQDVAELTGYAQPSTFIASFKRVMGTTPGAFASTAH